MSEPTHGRSLTRFLAVLLGLVMWMPVARTMVGIPSQPTHACSGSAPASPTGDFDGSPYEPNQASEAEDSESLDLLTHERAFPPTQYAIIGERARVDAYLYEGTRPAGGHGMLARERGPPSC